MANDAEKAERQHYPGFVPYAAFHKERKRKKAAAARLEKAQAQLNALRAGREEKAPAQ